MKDMMLQVEPLIPALRRYARALLRDRDAADDLVQDCLERAIGHWHQRRADSDARSWLFAILHNLAVSRLRQRTRRGWTVAIEDADEAVTAAPATQEDGLRYGELMRAVDTLPEDHRSVLLLVSVEDLSYAEAARVLDVPVGTVMSRLARAREKLHSALNADTTTPVQRPEAHSPQRTMLRRVK
jgi:RNA polymerase sigma-70 factor (ECF subfamily)